MDVSLFDFDLPRHHIAERPVSPRDAARLLVVQPPNRIEMVQPPTQDGPAPTLTDAYVRDLPDWLRPGDVLVSNDTAVIPARLRGKRGEAGVELTLHEALGVDCWKAFAKPAKKLRLHDQVDFAEDFSAQVIEKGDAGEVTLRFNQQGEALMLALEQWGRIPLPPYIRKGEADDSDRRDYQTLFARHKGAVAAPTAGLHFTPGLLSAIQRQGVQHLTLTLHVGAGTFLPVKADDTDQHHMHRERGIITPQVAETINQAKRAGGRIIAVGTTSLRLLESAALPDGTIQPFDGGTDIFITPGYDFRAVDVLMTNFHLPKSTLFMLVSAFCGLDLMQMAYQHAKQTGYRFYSYGDACLLMR